MSTKLRLPDGVSPTLHPSGEQLPNTFWLQDVFEELCSIREDQRPGYETIDAAPIIPDSRQRLHLPGRAETPLLLQISEQGFVPLLDALKIDHFILKPQDKLTKCLTSFRDAYERVWSLTPPDLIDSLHAKLSEINDARASWANRATIDPLLRFFESKWDDEARAKDAERLQRLKELPFFEDQNGNFGPVSNLCFRVGAFSLPPSINSLRLIRNNSLDRLLQAVGVHPLTRQSFLVNWILPHYPSQCPEVQLDSLRWIRDEWNRLVGEMGGAEEVAKLIGNRDFIRTYSGQMISIRACYHPNSRELIESILGDTVSFPDMSHYKDDPSLWLSFFENCGVQISPQVQDLAIHINKLVDLANDEDLSALISNAMVRVAKHIFSHWSELREKTVELRDQSPVPFCEYLRNCRWLPAARGRDLERFVVGEDPEVRFFRPDELYLFATGYLVSSKHPLLTTALPGLTSEVLTDLGIRSSPNWQDVADHFETLLNVLGEGPFTTENLKLTRTTFEAVYRYFGQSPDKFLGTDNSPTESNLVKGRFLHVPCILVEREKCLRRPCDVYKTARNLSPLKCVGKFNDPTLDKGLEVLGRADHPGVEDLAEALINLQTSRLEELDGSYQTAVNRSLDLLAELLSDALDDEQLPLIAVMNAQGRLVSPGSVIYGDDPWLVTELKISPDLLLHPDTPARIVHLWEMPSLRQATETPEHLEQKVSAEFTKQCETLVELLHSDEFQAGLERIVYDQHGRPSQTSCLNRVQIQPCSGLSCRYSIQLDDQDVDLGEASADFHFNAELEGGTIFVNQDCEEVFHQRIADCICRVLGDDGPRDKTALVTILQRKPGSIDGTLDRLRVKKLPIVHVVAINEVDHDDLFETVGTSVEFEDNTVEKVADEGDLSQELTAECEENLAFPDDEAKSDLHCAQQADTSQGYSNNQTISSSNRGNGNRITERSGGPSDAKVGGGTGRRGRMLPGRNNGGSGSGKAGQSDPRRSRVQGDRWTSYAVTKDQMDSNRNEDDSNDDESPGSHSIARSAVAYVMQYERSQGRKPQNMAQGNPGYDVESRQDSAIERYIEVKGIDAEWGKRGVPLSPLQLNYAQELGDKFWLYVVENCTSLESARLHMIQNPAAKITQFSFDSGWRQAGKEAISFYMTEPSIGLTLVDHNDDVVREGKIIEVSPSRNTIFLKVRFEQDAPACSFIYDPINMHIRE